MQTTLKYSRADLGVLGFWGFGVLGLEVEVGVG